MFLPDFFPTPTDVLDQMLSAEQIAGKVILEPSAGKGNIVTYCQQLGAKEVIACETNPELSKILQTKCRILKPDFMDLQSHEISHVDLIVMNPPFSKDVEHITRAFEIAPDGCKIIALCAASRLANTYTKAREQMYTLVQNYGQAVNLGQCFKDAERGTDVEISMVILNKPGTGTNAEFDGFFLEDEPEENGTDGLISYNLVRDVVNRYVEAVKIYDQQLIQAVKLNNMISGFYGNSLGFQVTEAGAPKQRNDFKKDLQKAGWKFIFSRLNMEKYSTSALKEDINKFVEQQEQIPFTMRNIYRMLEIVVGTTGQRMDKAINQVFDKVTMHYHENRHNVEGWKTNSHYLLNKRFIMPNITRIGWSGEVATSYQSHNFQLVEDLQKAMCFVSGTDYNDMISLNDLIDYPVLIIKDGKYLSKTLYDGFKVNHKFRKSEIDKALRSAEELGAQVQVNEINWGKWFNWGFFRVRCYKKGTMHFEFLDEKLWENFNKEVARIKGYPLFEPGRRTETKKQTTEKKQTTVFTKPVILGTYKVA